MKSLITYISEKLILNKNTKIKYNYHPKTKEELQDILKQLIEERGNDGNFNDIDTSEITDMSELFKYMKKFNGDISEWNVSKVIDMEGMFSHSKFNGDISGWNVSNVKNMQEMFDWCESFNQPLNNWDVSNVTNMFAMFCKCTAFNQDISKWNVSNVQHRFNMFLYCPIKEKYKPKFK